MNALFPRTCAVLPSLLDRTKKTRLKSRVFCFQALSVSSHSTFRPNVGLFAFIS